MFLFSISNNKNSILKQKLDEISEKYYIDIYRYCSSRLKVDISYAYDITNEVFELLYKKCNTLQDKNYKSWLYETADNLLKNFYKKYKRKVEKETYIGDMAETLSYEQNFENISEYEIEQYKDEILESLTEQERELFNMNNIEKLSRTQISERLFIPENTVKQRLYRLNQKIKDEVSKKLERIK